MGSALRLKEQIMKIKVLKLSSNEKRIIYGEMVDQFDLDYSQELDKLKQDIEFALSVLRKLQPKLFSKKNVHVYEGGHHLDIINNGVGSLGWLIIEDHPIIGNRE
ncbi:hypothetical protein HMPREF3107_02655 [Neisseria sp. HMSC31F04]|nr:hypothetical protein HMPREF3107_02655 [Neisseria sp. HMSC31F04]